MSECRVHMTSYLDDITPEVLAASKDQDKLDELLGLKPWEISPLEVEGPCVYPPGTGAALSWPKAVALREELESNVRFRG